EYRPIKTATIAIESDAGQRAKQRESYSVLPRGGAAEQILQIDTALAEPGGVIVKEQRETGRLVVQIRDQNFGGRPLSEQSIGEILFCDRRLSRLFPLVFRARDA